MPQIVKMATTGGAIRVGGMFNFLAFSPKRTAALASRQEQKVLRSRQRQMPVETSPDLVEVAPLGTGRNARTTPWPTMVMASA